MWQSILTALAVSVTMAVVGIIGKAVRDWSIREKAKAEAEGAKDARCDAIEALCLGVNTIGETVVNEMKAKAEDGKLSRDDIRIIQHKAIEEAVKVATSPSAIEFLTKTAFDTLEAIISGIVQGRKRLPIESD